jgi:hypothetical protein
MLLARTTLAAESALATSPVTSIGKEIGQSGRACDAASLDPQIRRAIEAGIKEGDGKLDVEIAKTNRRANRRVK